MIASCTTPTRRTRAGSTASGACTNGSTARRAVATRPVSGGAATTSTTVRRERVPLRDGVASSGQHPSGAREVAGVAVGIVLQVVLVLGFGLPERPGRAYLGDHLARPQP